MYSEHSESSRAVRGQDEEEQGKQDSVPKGLPVSGVGLGGGRLEGKKSSWSIAPSVSYHRPTSTAAPPTQCPTSRTGRLYWYRKKLTVCTVCMYVT